MTDEDLDIKTLETIRTLKLQGYMNESVGWSYRSSESKQIENRSLLRIAANGIVKVLTDEIGSFTPDEHGVLVTGENNPPAYTMHPGILDRDAFITDFNNSAFVDLCNVYGLDPNSDTYKATLSFIGIGTPVVSIGKNVYRFNSLHSDKNKEALLAVLSKRTNVPMSLDEVRKIKGFENTLYVSKLMENSIFSKGHTLSPFMTLSKNHIELHPERHLSISQVDAIKNQAKS